MVLGSGSEAKLSGIGRLPMIGALLQLLNFRAMLVVVEGVCDCIYYPAAQETAVVFYMYPFLVLGRQGRHGWAP